MPMSSVWSKIIFFSINILSTASFLTYARSHEVHDVFPPMETHKPHKPPGLHVPLIYSRFTSLIILSIDTSFSAAVPSGALVSLITGRAQCQPQQSQQTAQAQPASGWQLPAVIPRGESRGMGGGASPQLPTNARSNNLLPSPTGLASSTTSRVYNIFPSGDILAYRCARNFIKTQRWSNSSNLWWFSPGKTGRMDSRLLFPLHNTTVLPTHITDLRGCFKLALLFPLEQDVGFNIC